MQVILTNDDFALTQGLSRAVEASHLAGITTAASIRVDGPAFESVVQDVAARLPDLELGLHLNLTEGRPVAEPQEVPLLVDAMGRFRRSFAGYLFAGTRSGELVVQVERELAAQFARAVDHGLDLAFVNGNQHVHMVPWIFRLTCRLARSHGIARVRLPREPRVWAGGTPENLHLLRHLNFAKHLLLNRLSARALPVLRQSGLRSVDHFVGVLYSGRMTASILSAFLGQLASRGGEEVVEVLFHPAYVDDPRDAADSAGESARHYAGPYYFAPQRRWEMEALLGEDIQRVLAQRRVALTTHRSALTQ